MRLILLCYVNDRSVCLKALGRYPAKACCTTWIALADLLKADERLSGKPALRAGVVQPVKRVAPLVDAFEEHAGCAPHRIRLIAHFRPEPAEELSASDEPARRIPDRSIDEKAHFDPWSVRLCRGVRASASIAFLFFATLEPPEEPRSNRANGLNENIQCTVVRTAAKSGSSLSIAVGYPNRTASAISRA